MPTSYHLSHPCVISHPNLMCRLSSCQWLRCAPHCATPLVPPSVPFAPVLLCSGCLPGASLSHPAFTARSLPPRPPESFFSTQSALFWFLLRFSHSHTVGPFTLPHHLLFLIYIFGHIPHMVFVEWLIDHFGPSIVSALISCVMVFSECGSNVHPD